MSDHEQHMVNMAHGAVLSVEQLKAERDSLLTRVGELERAKEGYRQKKLVAQRSARDNAAGRVHAESRISSLLTEREEQQAELAELRSEIAELREALAEFADYVQEGPMTPELRIRLHRARSGLSQRQEQG